MGLVRHFRFQPLILHKCPILFLKSFTCIVKDKVMIPDQQFQFNSHSLKMKLVKFLDVMKNALLIILVSILSLPFSNSAYAAPDFADGTLPTMTRFSQKLQLSNGEIHFITEVTLRWKKNQPTKFSGVMVTPDFNFAKNPLLTPCYSVGGRAGFGSVRPTGGNSRNIEPNETLGNSPDGDFTLTNYRFVSVLNEPIVNPETGEKRNYCRGLNKVLAIYIEDETGRIKSIVDNRLVNSPQVGVTVYQQAGIWQQLPSLNTCPEANSNLGGNYAYMRTLCDSVDPTLSSIMVDESIFSQAKEAKAKAEAEAKAKAEAEAKAKAETKNKTITCIKGKLTKKVTGVNPKCPKGYKKK